MIDSLLHVTLHGGNAHERGRVRVDWNGRSLNAIQVDSAELTAPLPVLFDDLYPQLESLPRFYAEPDGSILWTSTDGPKVWQIDGQLHDSAGNLMTIEFKLSGQPPRPGLRAAMDEILERIAPREQLVFELVRPGIYIDYDEFVSLIPGA